MRFRSAILLASVAFLGACNLEDSSQPSVPANETFVASLGVDLSTFTKVSNDLYYKDLVVGTGNVAQQNQLISFDYAGWLTNGTTFDSGTLVDYPLDVAHLITGLVLGIPGMKVGGKRKLVIGSSYGYGAQQKGTIPPHSTLVFDIELKALK